MYRLGWISRCSDSNTTTALPTGGAARARSLGGLAEAQILCAGRPVRRMPRACAVRGLDVKPRDRATVVLAHGQVVVGGRPGCRTYSFPIGHLTRSWPAPQRALGKPDFADERAGPDRPAVMLRSACTGHADAGVR